MRWQCIHDFANVTDETHIEHSIRLVEDKCFDAGQIDGSLMHVIERGENGFTSIPRSVYWAIVTLTTVGYGDISPRTAPGQFLAAIVMILGYSIIAVPTGIVTVELAHASAPQRLNTQACPSCSAEGHDNDAVHCKFCGVKL